MPENALSLFKSIHFTPFLLFRNPKKVNESWDLIDASEDEYFEYEELKESDLPIALQGKSEPQIKLYLSKKREERKNIQDQIQDLNLKRKQYVLEQQTQGENNLEKAILNALKIQAKKKNYNWE